ncbi:MAG TPA: DUF6328 family protein [Actinomycetota bacterium]|nr:DUF6328 family protein [Actinomycetota bacterium]
MLDDRETPTQAHETDKERVDRELVEFLNEVRVVLRGVTVLFAFLLTLPFTGRFDSITSGQRFAYALAFYTTALATAMLTAPTALHRIRFRRGDKETMLRASNRLAMVGIACFAVSLVAVVWLVSELLFELPVAVTIALVAAAIVISLWFVLPLSRAFSPQRRTR